MNIKKIVMVGAVLAMAGAAVAADQPVILGTRMRSGDPTIMDVTYIVHSTNATVKTRALAFQDGERTYEKAIRPKTFVNDADGNPTAGNIGDGVPANTQLKLSWKVPAEWSVDLAYVKFEILCSNQAILPQEFLHIPAFGKYNELTVMCKGDQSTDDLKNASLWHFADTGIKTDSYGNSFAGKKAFYELMGLASLTGTMLNYARQKTHRELWYNSDVQNAWIPTNAIPEKFYIGEKAYCVIDVSGGTNAVTYPVTYLDYDMPKGWPDEYKTTKILLRRCEAGRYDFQKTKPVWLTKPFYMGVFTITQKQYVQVMGTNPTQSGHQGDLRPVEISWNAIRGVSTTYNWPTVTTVDPSTFVGKIQAKTGLNFDLPTEAQWEYACRAGTSSNYGNGGGNDNDLQMMGHSWSDSSVNVGLYQPNFWGLYDMHGNVGQWCLDYSDGYNTDPAIDYVGAESGSSRVIRGYYYFWSWEDYCYATSFYRYGEAPSSNYYYHYSIRYENGGSTYLGFRLSRTLAE